jgi:hypothetical protein
MTLAQLQDFAPLNNDAEWETIPLPSTDAYWIALVGIPLAAATIIGLFLWRLPLSTPIHPWRHVLHCRSAFKDSATDNPRFGRILRSVAALAATALRYAIVFPALCYALFLLLVLPGWLNQQQTTGSDGPGTYPLVTGHFIITGDSDRGTVRAIAPSGKPVEETLVDVARTQNSSIGPPQWIMLADHLVLHYGNDSSDDERTWYAIRYSDYTVTGPAVRQDIQSLIGQELNSVHLPRIIMQPWLSPTASVHWADCCCWQRLQCCMCASQKAPSHPAALRHPERTDAANSPAPHPEDPRHYTLYIHSNPFPAFFDI